MLSRWQSAAKECGGPHVVEPSRVKHWLRNSAAPEKWSVGCRAREMLTRDCVRGTGGCRRMHLIGWIGRFVEFMLASSCMRQGSKWPG